MAGRHSLGRWLIRPISLVLRHVLPACSALVELVILAAQYDALERVLVGIRGIFAKLDDVGGGWDFDVAHCGWFGGVCVCKFEMSKGVNV